MKTFHEQLYETFEALNPKKNAELIRQAEIEAEIKQIQADD